MDGEQNHPGPLRLLATGGSDPPRSAEELIAAAILVLIVERLAPGSGVSLRTLADRARARMPELAAEAGPVLKQLRADPFEDAGASSPPEPPSLLTGDPQSIFAHRPPAEWSQIVRAALSGAMKIRAPGICAEEAALTSIIQVARWSALHPELELSDVMRYAWRSGRNQMIDQIRAQRRTVLFDQQAISRFRTKHFGEVISQTPEHELAYEDACLTMIACISELSWPTSVIILGSLIEVSDSILASWLEYTPVNCRKLRQRGRRELRQAIERPSRRAVSCWEALALLEEHVVALARRALMRS